MHTPDDYMLQEYVDKFNARFFGKKASFKYASFVTDKNIKIATDQPFGTGVENKLKKKKELL